MVPERRKFTDFQGSDATGPDFSEKRQFAAKPCVINRVVQEGKFSDFHGSRATVSEGGKWPYV